MATIKQNCIPDLRRCRAQKSLLIPAVSSDAADATTNSDILAGYVPVTTTTIHNAIVVISTANLERLSFTCVNLLAEAPNYTSVVFFKIARPPLLKRKQTRAEVGKT